jgi:uncharacterized Fe-S cluster-containing protein
MKGEQRNEESTEKLLPRQLSSLDSCPFTRQETLFTDAFLRNRS